MPLPVATLIKRLPPPGPPGAALASSGKGKPATLFVGRDQESARAAANREEFGIFGKGIWALSTLTEKGHNSPKQLTEADNKESKTT